MIFSVDSKKATGSRSVGIWVGVCARTVVEAKSRKKRITGRMPDVFLFSKIGLQV